MMQENLDYIGFCNLTLAEFRNWVNGREWRYLRKADGAPRKGRRRFSTKEVEGFYGNLRAFRFIVVKWAEGESLTDKEKMTVIRRYFVPRSGKVPRGAYPLIAVNHWFEWDGDRLSDAEFKEIVDTTSTPETFLFGLYRDLFLDVRRQDEKGFLKPKFCSLVGQKGTTQKTCGRLYRPSVGHQVYCSATCSSNARSRRAYRKKDKPLRGYLIP